MIFIVDLNRDLNQWFKSCQPCSYYYYGQLI